MRARDERGAAAVMVALCLVVLILATGFTVDLGALAARTRRLQALADLIALDSAKELNGRSCNAPYTNPGETVASTQYDHVAAAAVASSTRNGHNIGGTSTLTVELGKLTRDIDGKVVYDSAGNPQFTAIASCSTSAEVPDAVRVTAGSQVEYEFARVVGFDSASPRRSAIGVQRPIGAFSIGSAVGTFDASRSAILNRLLGRLLCPPPQAACNAGVTAVGYTGLASTNVTLGQLQAALGVGSVSSLLNSNVTASQLFTVAAAAASGSTAADADARTALASLASTTTSTGTIKLRDYITIQQGGTDSAGNDVTAQTGVNLLQMVQATAALSNGSSALTVPTAAITLPAGITSMTVSLALVEGPKTIVGQPGATITTRQVRMTITPTLNISVSAGVFGSAARITGPMPIVVTGGTATGTLTATSCYTGSFPSIGTTTTVNAASSSASGTLSVTSLLGINLGTLTMSGTAVSTTTGSFADTFQHTADYYVARSYGNNQVGLSSTNLGSSTFKAPLVPAVTIPLGAATAILGAIGPIDTLVVEPITDLLGLSLGAADVTAVDPLVCNAPTIGG